MFNLDDYPEGQWNAAVAPDSTEVDVQGLLTHEWLHTLGFGEGSGGDHWNVSSFPYLCGDPDIYDYARLVMCADIGGGYGTLIGSYLQRQVDEHNDQLEYRDSY